MPHVPGKLSDILLRYSVNLHFAKLSHDKLFFWLDEKRIQLPPLLKECLSDASLRAQDDESSAALQAEPTNWMDE